MDWQHGKNIPDFYLTERVCEVRVYAIEEPQVQLWLLLPLILTLPLTEPHVQLETRLMAMDSG